MRLLFIATIITTTLFSCDLFKKKQNNEGIVTNFDTTSYLAESPAYDEDASWTGDGEILFADYKPSKTKYWLLRHTELIVNFDFQKRRMPATAFLTLQANIKDNDTLTLDAKNLDISGIYASTVNQEKPNAPLKFIYTDSAKLIVILNSKIKAGTEINLRIDYIAKTYEISKTGGNAAITDDRGLYFINHDLKNPSIPRQIWTQGETESNSHWFPTIDAPNQKMTQKTTMTVPDTMVTLSNGTLIKSTNNSNQTRTDIWEQKQPHAPYLTMMAIGNWATIRDKWRGKDVNYLVDKKYADFAKLNFGNTPEMMEFFSNYTGVDFPWDKYSQVVVHEFVSGAMENTSATVHMEGLQQLPEEHADHSMEDYVSHELFHQWFGDLVTAESWANITVNESFATYGEYLWRKHKYGSASANYILDDFKQNYNWLGMDEGKKLVRFDYEKEGDVFDAVSYQKGALILHMLQYAIGEDIFKNGLKIYLNKYKFGTAEADDLREAMEEASGQDLHWFWDQWYYGKGHPKISLLLNNNQTKNIYELEVQQTQTFRNAFVFPIKITWSEKGILKSKKTTITKRNQTIELTKGIIPDWYIFDSDNTLLADVEISALDITDLEKQVTSLRFAYDQMLDEGLKYRLFTKAANIADYAQENNLKKAILPFLEEALHSNYSFTINRALRFISSNTEYILDGNKIKIDSIFSIVRNRKKPSDSRALGIYALYNLKTPEDSILNYTADPSPMVSNRAIEILDDRGKWISQGMNQMQKETRGMVAKEWAIKLLSSGQVNKIAIVEKFLLNPSIDLNQFYSTIKIALTLSNNEEDIHIANYIYNKLTQEHNSDYLKMMLLIMESELKVINRELLQQAEDGQTPDKNLVEKQKLFEKIATENTN